MFKSQKLATAALVVGTVLAGTAAASAQAPVITGPASSPYGVQPVYSDRPLTVVGHRHAYNPYAGPAAIVTAPVHVAGEVAALPFRVINSVFPARGNSPLVLVGAPVYLASQIVRIPFDLVQAPFGGPAPFED